MSSKQKKKPSKKIISLLATAIFGIFFINQNPFTNSQETSDNNLDGEVLPIYYEGEEIGNCTFYKLGFNTNRWRVDIAIHNESNVSKNITINITREFVPGANFKIIYQKNMTYDGEKSSDISYEFEIDPEDAMKEYIKVKFLNREK